MKKFMSLVIAVLFALGMTTVAFAADTTAPATEKPAAEKMEKKAPKKKAMKKKAMKKKAAPKTEEKAETPAK